VRIRLARLAFFVFTLMLALSSCRTAGVRYVVMALDTDGSDPRSTFFVDSRAVVCVVKMSVGDPDTFVTSVLRQTATIHWDDTSPTNPNPFTTPPDHPLFAATEQKPSVGSEENVAFSLNTTGTGATVACLGYCVVDPPPGLDPCLSGYAYQGTDSCGFGAACCFNPNQMAGMSMQQTLPYPAGQYSCDVYVNGEYAASAPFAIEYACTPDEDISGSGPCCPTDPPSAGVPCRFWVPKGTTCAGYETGTKCTCNSYYWECQ
jgi:hypothetical protein